MYEIAVDTRYKYVTDIPERPNELEIQELSGLRATLWGLPYYERDVQADVWDLKAEMKYSLLARSTINYDESGCSVSLQEAQRTLGNMASASNRQDLTFGIMIAAWIYVGLTTLSILIPCCLDKRDALEAVIGPTHIFGTLFDFALAITISVSFKRILDEQSALSDWQESDGCVENDHFMRISEHGATAISNTFLWAVLSLAAGWLVFCMQGCMVKITLSSLGN